MKKIMIVDDDKNNQQTLKQSLEAMDSDYKVTCASNGIQCLELMKNNEIPDLILLDIMMPKMSGWETFQNLQQNPLWKDIPVFFDLNYKKTDEMKQVKFELIQRIEMAIMWVFLASIVLMPIWGSLFKIEAVFLLVQIIFVYLLVLISFPLFERIFQKEVEKKKVFFTWGNLIVFLINIVYASIGVILYAIIYQNDYSLILIRWCIISFLLVLIINMELKGSSPTYKSDSHADKLFDVEIDLEKCKGTGICVDVCPRNCYELDTEIKKITMPRQEYCVQCSACIVQCPYDALYFINRKGDIIKPETIRKYKLNLLGKRT